MNAKLGGFTVVAAAALLVSLSFAQPPAGRERGPRDRTGPPREPGVQRPDDRPRGPGDSNRRGPGGGPGRSRNPVILALDADGDGELSPSEIARADEALKTLDKDGDGKLSREELRPAQGGRGGTGRPDDRRPPRDDPRMPGSGERRGGERPEPRGGGQDTRAESRTDASPPTRRTALPSSIPGFVGIPGGEFEMGDHHDLGGREHRSDEVPIHKVRVDSFYMARTEMTNGEYCEFLNSSLAKKLVEVDGGLVRGTGAASVVYCDTQPSDTASSIRWDGRTFTVVDGRQDHPMVCVRWHGAVAYCNWLSAEKGYEACYDLSTWECNFSKRGFRLPTEAEWEYAGRGGRYGPYCVFPWGDEPDNARANWPNSGDPYETGSLSWTTPVGFYNGKLHRKADFGWPGSQETYQTSDGANGYGLHDMSGNVWEWVHDWYQHDYYATSPAANPHGPEKGQPMRDGKPYRVLRSGSWYNGQWGHGRVANRNPSYYRGPQDPNHRWYHIGFRVVLPMGRTGSTEGNSARKSANP